MEWVNSLWFRTAVLIAVVVVTVDNVVQREWFMVAVGAVALLFGTPSPVAAARGRGRRTGAPEA